MGNTTSVTINNSSSIYEWVKTRFSSSGVTSSNVNATPSGLKPNVASKKGSSTKAKQDTAIAIQQSLPESVNKKEEVTQNLQDLLTSLTTEDNLQRILTEKLYLDEDIYTSFIIQGTVADDFRKYLKENYGKDERHIEKFYFLLLTDIVLSSKNKNDQVKVFDHLTSLFFSEHGKMKDFIKFPNSQLGEKLYSYTKKNSTKECHALEEDAIKYLNKAKYSLNIWEGDKGLVPIYMHFHNSISQKSNFCACLLSIL